jgi:hypothetical protein
VAKQVQLGEVLELEQQLGLGLGLYVQQELVQVQERP